MVGRLTGKVALITGTADGQGRAAARLFAQEGAIVVGCDLKGDENQKTAQMVTGSGGQMDAATLDITEAQAAKDWVNAAAKRHGGIDIVYNNAALEWFAPFAEMSADDWHRTIRYELDGLFFVTQAAWSHLITRGGGSIINTASVSGMRANEHIGSIAHAAGKGGVIALTHQLALEGAPHNIRANAISPGPINTPATLPQLDKDPSFRLTYEGWTLLNRTGEPEDIAYCALWLASDESSFVTGINVPVDGGWSAKGGLTAKSGELAVNQRP
ncbi:SDR family NAD(P)-dependent oxidoreductase [Leptolyngbya sp. NIES-2104]|uniref:SDR family NAD(P)-dependent oxidoreductase n=1 Tax=Leptolyngbya sp. NIES-2104 TaxID=1552121 RepID=UPI0006EC8771|nr:SDR family NAD(P)-dependent oxidoreductase [Leptolyngbya sp. NIES-2104]GAP98019.1 short-chain dehydrogenase/reductase SDR [Leptolyngbya sp. NIES-2104]